MLKALFVVEVFTFLSRPFGDAEKRLHNRLMLISKFMASQTGQHVIAIHILSNILGSEGNQTMNFGQLTEHEIRNITFLGNHAQNVVEKLVLDAFIKNKN